MRRRQLRRRGLVARIGVGARLRRRLRLGLRRREQRELRHPVGPVSSLRRLHSHSAAAAAAAEDALAYAATSVSSVWSDTTASAVIFDADA